MRELTDREARVGRGGKEGVQGTRGEGQDEVVLMGIPRCLIAAVFTYILIFHT